MAENSGESSIFTPFQILIGRIGSELDTFDVKYIKNLLFEASFLTESELEGIDTKEPGAGLDLISKLQIYRLVAPNNRDLLKELLKNAKACKVLDELKNFVVTELFDSTKGQMEKLSDHLALYLVLSGKKELILDEKIQKLKSEICKCIGLKEVTTGHLPYICSSESNKNTVARFQFPQHSYEKIAEKLTTKKDSWLTENGVIMLKVDGESSINIQENVEFNPPQIEDDIVIEKKPRLEVHKKNILDVILVVEMPTTVTSNDCRAMLRECQSAVDVWKSEDHININLAVIRYGNHSTSQQPAFVEIIQDFSQDLDVSSKLKDKGRWGDHGNSGMADALAKVVELANGKIVRPRASKVCILITFLSKQNKNLEYYRCHHENDVIKLSNCLADHEIPLYIFGISDGRIEDDLCHDEGLLAGICHIGGGRYFRIANNEITQMITSVVKNDLSIENHGEMTREAVKDALVYHHGDVNTKQLAKHVSKDPRMAALHSQKLLQNGKSLELISQVAQRVDMADDLNDAIDAINRMQERKEAHEKGEARGCALVCPGKTVRKEEDHILISCKEESDTEMDWEDTCIGKKRVNVNVRESIREHSATSTEVEEKEIIDLEMATRIVKRHLHRMAYFKKNT